MKKIILFFISVLSISISGYSQSRNFSTLGNWSIETKIDDYSGDTIKKLEYKSTEKIINSISKVQCVYNKDKNSLKTILIVDDISSHDYIWNAEYLKESSDFKYNFIKRGKYRYTSGVNNFDEHDLNTIILYNRMNKNYSIEIFDIENINLSEMNSKQYLNIRFTDKINNTDRIIKISLTGFIDNFNKL